MLQTLYRNYYWIKKTIENKVIRINLQLRSSQLWKISRIISRGAGNVAAILFPRAKLRSALVMGAFRWWWWWYTVLLRARCVTVLYYLHEKISTSGKEHPGPLPRPMAVLCSCFVVCFHGRTIRIGGGKKTVW